MEEEQKKIDERWKEAVRREAAEMKAGDAFTPPEPDFSFFATTLALQASIALGQMPNPSTQKTDKDLTQAKFLIDTLGVLQVKTRGNLDDKEQKLLDNLLYELKLAYVHALEGKP